MKIDTELSRLYIRTDPPKALERARRAAAIARARGPSLDGIDPHQMLGEVGTAAGQREEAVGALVEALAWSDRYAAVGVKSGLLAEWGTAQERLGQVESAETTLKRAVAMAERLKGSDELLEARSHLAKVQVKYRLLHDYFDTVGPLVDLARKHRLDAASRHLLAMVMATHGRAWVAYGDATRGLAALDEARAMLPPETTPSLRGQFNLARAHASALIALNRVTEAGADIERELPLIFARGERVAEMGRVRRREYLVAAGRGPEALQDFIAHPPQAAARMAKANPFELLPRQVEEASLLLAAGQPTAARAAATNAREAIGRLPERRFTRDAEPQLTAVLGQALLREGRAEEALPVLQKSLALHLAQYDPVRSPSVANARRALAEALRALGDPRAAGAEQEAEEEVRRAQTRATARR